MARQAESLAGGCPPVCGGRGLPVQAPDSSARFGHHYAVFICFNIRNKGTNGEIVSYFSPLKILINLNPKNIDSVEA